MPDFDLNLVHPSVSDEDLDRAHDGEPALFQGGGDQDTLDAAASLVVIPATPRQALATLKKWRDDHVFVGARTCLMTQRRAWNLPALWPTANDGFDNAAPLHHFADLSKVPRGMVFWYGNDDAGHVVTSLGGGLCDTTDFHETGFLGVALLSRVGEWCGATSMAGGETLNGFDVWPSPVKPKPEPKPFTLEDRLRIVQHRLHAMRAEGHDKRAARFELWAEELRAKIEAHR